MENQNMNDDMVEIVDIDGEEFEKLDELEFEGNTYFALIPYSEDDDYNDEDVEIDEFGILRRVEENGEFFLETIEDDDLLDKVGALFEKRIDERFGE